jgi:hypothetical protein
VIVRTVLGDIELGLALVERLASLGVLYVFARFKPRLERELGARLAEQVFVANPARAFAWDPTACPTV